MGYGVSTQGGSVDDTKIEVIQSLPIPKTITEVKSFHGLTSFYRRLIKDFSIIIALMIECMKKGEFKWTTSAQVAFEHIQQRLCEAPILALPDFDEFLKLNVMIVKLELGSS